MYDLPLIARPATADTPAQSVADHLTETATLAASFVSPALSSDVGELLGFLHDLGKYSSRFQEYIHGLVKRENGGDHSTAGAQLLWEMRGKPDHYRWGMCQILAQCTASHHGGLMDALSPGGRNIFGERMDKSDEKTCRSSAQKLADAEILSRVEELIKTGTGLAALATLLEGIQTGDDSAMVRDFHYGLLCRFLFSCLIDADRMSAAGRQPSAQPIWENLGSRLQAKLDTFDQDTPVNQVRHKISEACFAFASRDKGLFKLSVPTGGGKTLSSLRHAIEHARIHGMERIIYVTPYTSIIEQNAEEVRAILERPDEPLVVLEHHSNIVEKNESEDESANILLGENWDAPVIFTTSVQLLNALFDGGTRSARRMHRLTNSVIIFDEVQTLPVKTVHLFNNTLNFLTRHCGSTAVMCTATQPLLNEVDTKKGCLEFTGIDGACEMAPPSLDLFQRLKRVEVRDRCKKKGWSETEIADLAVEECEASGNVLVVTNTRKWARALFDLCLGSSAEVYHLSASMCPAHRSRKLAEIKERIKSGVGKSTICISTQLIEAGVDIDFNAGIRFRAGLDSIAQAAGRVNRNGHRASAYLTIVNPDEESIQYLADIREGEKVAARVLREFHDAPARFNYDILSPELMRRYYEYSFYDRRDEMDYKISSRDSRETLLSLLSTNTQSVKEFMQTNGHAPPLFLRQSFKTAGRKFQALDSATTSVVVPFGDGKNLIGELCAHYYNSQIMSRLLRQAQRYSVNIYEGEKKRLFDAGALHETTPGSGVYFLDDRFYDGNLGIVSEPTGTMPLLVTEE